MKIALLLCLTVAAGAVPPLELAVVQENSSFRVDFELREGLPPSFEKALPSGALVRVVYPLQIRSDRRLWWDRKLWRGEVVASAHFDPVTGRYRCELVLDEIVVASEELGAVDDARRWLVDPPAVRISPEEQGRLERMSFRVRAVFSSATRWLVFPTVQGTDWVEFQFGETAVAPRDGGADEATGESGAEAPPTP